MPSRTVRRARIAAGIVAILSLCIRPASAGDAAGHRIEPALNGLKSSTPAERVFAAETLAWAGATHAIPAILPLLSDRTATVRKAAAEALGDLGARDAVPGLLRLLDDTDASVRAAAARALGLLAAPQAADKLRSALNDRSPDVRAAAVLAVGDLALDDAAAKLVALLDDREDQVRAHAVVVLAAMNRRDLKGRFVELLDDPGPCTPIKAAAALGALGARDAVPRIRRLLERPLQALGTLQVRITLAQLGDGDLDALFAQLAPQLDQLEKQPMPQGVVRLVDALARIPTAAARARLEKLARSERWPIRREASRKLGLEWRTADLVKPPPGRARWYVLVGGLIVLGVLIVLLKKTRRPPRPDE